MTLLTIKHDLSLNYTCQFKDRTFLKIGQLIDRMLHDIKCPIYEMSSYDFVIFEMSFYEMSHVTALATLVWVYMLPRIHCGNFKCRIVVGKEQDSDDEQIDKGITLKSKSIMQKTLYFLKKMKWIMINNYYNGLRIYNEKILTIYLSICGLNCRGVLRRFFIH